MSENEVFNISNSPLSWPLIFQNNSKSKSALSLCFRAYGWFMYSEQLKKAKILQICYLSSTSKLSSRPPVKAVFTFTCPVSQIPISSIFCSTFCFQSFDVPSLESSPFWISTVPLRNSARGRSSNSKSNASKFWRSASSDAFWADDETMLSEWLLVDDELLCLSLTFCTLYAVEINSSLQADGPGSFGWAFGLFLNGFWDFDFGLSANSASLESEVSKFGNFKPRTKSRSSSENKKKNDSLQLLPKDKLTQIS